MTMASICLLLIVDILFPIHGRLDAEYITSTLKCDSEFKDKKEGIMWRGSSTGPLNDSSSVLGRVNRLEFIENLYNKYPDIDVAFNRIVSSLAYKYDDNIHQRLLQHIRRKTSECELTRYKYALCIEGNDISLRFIGALASKSCPLHTYLSF
jgi:hypothetical protein